MIDPVISDTPRSLFKMISTVSSYKDLSQAQRICLPEAEVPPYYYSSQSEIKARFNYHPDPDSELLVVQHFPTATTDDAHSARIGS